ncbi:MAG: hypothetical protein ACI9W6_001513 [Motiliproteus sp.]
MREQAAEQFDVVVIGSLFETLDKPVNREFVT